MSTETDLLWSPSRPVAEGSNIAGFMRWLSSARGLSFSDYTELWRWSTTDVPAFWSAVWEFYDLDAVSGYQEVLEDPSMPGASWFPGARLNFAERCLARATTARPALISVPEGGAPVEMSWEQLGRRVAAVAASLREMGVEPGDRIAGYLPNTADAVVALLAAPLSARCGRCARRTSERAACSRDCGRHGRRSWSRRTDTTTGEGVRPAPGGRRDRGRAAHGPAPARDRSPPHVLGRIAVVAADGRGAARMGRPGGTAGGTPLRRRPVRPPTVDSVVVRHHGRAEGHRAVPRRHRRGAAQGPRTRCRPAERRSLLLPHLHQLDGVEPHGRRSAARCHARPVRRQPHPSRCERRLAGRPADRCDDGRRGSCLPRRHGEGGHGPGG